MSPSKAGLYMLENDGLLGWATADLVRLDGLSQGLISRVLTVSPATRHAIFLVLAHRQHDRIAGGADDEASDIALANILRRDRAHAVIKYAIGPAGDGLLGALARLGAAPLSSPSSYVRLVALFRRAEDRHKGEALQHVGEITDRMLRVLDALDPRWVHRETLTRVETMVEAVMFNRAVAFAQSVCSRATDEAVAGAIARLQPTSTLVGLAQRFVRRADRFPIHPIQGDNEVRPFNAVTDFFGAARAYRNCLSDKIEVALVGRAAFAEFRGEAILEFRPLSDGFGWMLKDVHIARNMPVPSATKRAAEVKCAALGIPYVDEDAGMDRLQQYRRFVVPKHWEWAE
jgi:hypothetical protein